MRALRPTSFLIVLVFAACAPTIPSASPRPRATPAQSSGRARGEANAASADTAKKDSPVVEVEAARTRLRAVPQIGHSGLAGAIAFSPDGALYVTGGQDNVVKLWDSRSGLLLRTMRPDADGLDRIDDVGFSPDGARVIMASSGGTRAHYLEWDTKTGASVRHFMPPLETAPEGAISLQPIAQTYDGGKGILLHDLNTGTFSLVDAASGKRVRTLATTLRYGSSDQLKTVPEHVLIVTRTGLTMWTPARDTPPTRVTLRNSKSDDGLVDAELLPDGKRAIVSFESSLALIDLATKKPVWSRKMESGLKPISLSADGTRALASADEGTLLYLDVTTGDTLRTLKTGSHRSAESIAIAPDGRTALTSGYELATVYWDLETGEFLRRANANLDGAGAVDASRDGRLVAIAGYNGGLHVWRRDTLALDRAFAVAPKTTNVSFDARTTALVSSGEWSPPRIVSLIPDHKAPALDGHTILGTPERAWFSFDGSRVVASRDQLETWDATTGASVGKSSRSTLECSRESDDGIIVCGLFDQRLAIFRDAPDLTNVDIIGTPRGMDEPEEFMWTAAISRDGKRAATATSRGALMLWDLEQKKLLRKLPAHQGNVEDIAFFPDGSAVVTGGHDGLVKIWDFASGNLRRTLTGHGFTVQTVAVTPDARHIVSGGGDAIARIWRVDNGDAVSLAAAGNEWIAFTDDGYFDASRRGGELIAAVDELRGYRIDQLAIRNNRPDVLLTRLGLGTPDLIDHYRTRYLRRLAKLGLDPERVTASLDRAPEASITRLDVSNKTAQIAFDVKDTAELLRYNVYINDVPVFAAGRAISGREQHLSEKIELTKGRNRIEVGAVNRNGVESLRPFRDVTYSGNATSNLYYVGFGVSRYANPKYNLGWPHKDVLDIGEVLGAMKGGFGEVQVRTYVNEQATVAAFDDAKKFLAQASVDDTVILFVAGHGVHAQDANAEYYFATHEIDLSHLPQTAASFDVVEGLLENIAPRRKLFLMDTCESGERDDSDDETASIGASAGADAGAGSRGLHTRSVRALVLDVEKSASKEASRPRPYLFEKDRFIYNDLARRSGAIVLSSSRGSELSYELDDLKNGVFTKEIVTALVTPAADRDRDGAVSSEELRDYVAKAVATRTNDQQHPTVDRDNLDMTISLPLTLSAASVLTRDDPSPTPEAQATQADPSAPVTTASPARPPQGCGCRVASPSADERASVLAFALAAVACARRRRSRQRRP